MKTILHVLAKDQKAGAEAVVQSIIYDKDLNKNYSFKVLILALFWKSESKLFPENTVSLWTALTSKWFTIHTHLFWGGLCGFFLRFFHPRTRWIHSVHYIDYEKLKHGSLKKIIDSYLVFSRADHLHGVSHASDPLLKEHKSKLHIIENTFSFDRTKKANIPYDGSQLKILTVAFFRQEKGLDRILSTAQSLKYKKIDFKWTICGEGPQFDIFKADIVNHGLQSYFTLTGFKADLDPYYSLAHLYIQPSYSESFGLSVYDAFQYKLPVISSAVGHLKNLFQHDLLGTLVESDENFSANLSEKIEHFIQNSKLFYDKAIIAYNSFIQKKNDQDFSHHWHQFYNLKAVVFLSPITTQATGGIQKQLLLQTKEITSHGYEVYIIQKNDDRLDHTLTEKWDHCRVYGCYNIKTGTHLSFIQRMNGLIYILHGFYYLLKIRNIKVVHALQMYSPTLLAVMAKTLFNCRAVVKVTASGAMGEVSQLKILPFQKLRTIAFKRVDHFLALTEPMKNELIEYGIKKEQVRVVPNSVEFFPKIEINPLKKNDAFNILYTGRISTEKSLETLIEATLLLAQNFPDQKINLVLVGGLYQPRNNFQQLTELISHSPINLTIKFEGFQSKTQSYYLNAHVFCLPSVSEGMSNALLEALSYGLPCIVSNIEANTAVVQSENNGLVYPVGNSTKLFLQLTRILVDLTENNCVLSKRLSLSAHTYINAHFSVESVCSKIREAYQG